MPSAGSNHEPVDDQVMNSPGTQFPPFPWTCDILGCTTRFVDLSTYYIISELVDLWYICDIYVIYIVIVVIYVTNVVYMWWMWYIFDISCLSRWNVNKKIKNEEDFRARAGDMHVSWNTVLWQMTGKLLVASYSTPRSELAAGPHLNPDGRASLLDGPRGGDASDSVPSALSFPWSHPCHGAGWLAVASSPG